MDTKLSSMNLAMAQVLRDAEPKSISRRKAAASMSISEGQLNRLLGGNQEYLRDISITVLFELADVWGVELTDLIERAEKIVAGMSAATDTTGAGENFDVEPNVDKETLGLAAHEGERKIDRE